MNYVPPVTLFMIDFSSDQTFQDYLRENFERLFPEAQQKLSIACLTYLQFDAFAGAWGDILRDWNHYRETHKLLDYAAVNWGHHLNRAHEPEEGRQLALYLLQDTRKCANASHFLTLGDNIFVGSPDGPTRGFSGLHILAHFGLDLTMTDLLSIGQTMVDPRDEWKLTPLLTVTRPGRVAVAKVLLDHGADINAEDAFGRSPLSFAAEHGSTNMVDFLLSRKVNINHQGGFEQRTPLLWASYGGHAEIVRLLLRRDDVKLDARNYQGFTAISYACGNGHEDIAKLLLARGADYNIPDHKEQCHRTPLAWAASRGHISILKLMAAHDEHIDSRDQVGSTPFLLAAIFDNAKVLHALKDLNADIHAVDHLGRNALTWAGIENSVSALTYLIEILDFDPNFRDVALRTPLFWACWHGAPNAAEYLLSHGADPNALNDLAETPLMVAAKVGRPNAVAQLLKHPDIQIDYRDKSRRTSLSYALQFQKEAVARKLLEAGADVNIQGQMGRSCLSIAAQWSRFQIFEMVANVERADLGSLDKQGQSPLAHALAELRYSELMETGVDVRRRGEKVVELLRERGEEVEEEVVERVLEVRMGRR